MVRHESTELQVDKRPKDAEEEKKTVVCKQSWIQVYQTEAKRSVVCLEGTSTGHQVSLKPNNLKKKSNIFQPDSCFLMI